MATRPADGLEPSRLPPLKAYNMLSWPVVGSILKTVPQPRKLHPLPPPKNVVPYSEPLRKSKPAAGNWPSDPPAKRYTTVSVPDGSILKTVPQPKSEEQAVPPPAEVVP